MILPLRIVKYTTENQDLHDIFWGKTFLNYVPLNYHLCREKNQFKLHNFLPFGY